MGIHDAGSISQPILSSRSAELKRDWIALWGETESPEEAVRAFSACVSPEVKS